MKISGKMQSKQRALSGTMDYKFYPKIVLNISPLANKIKDRIRVRKISKKGIQ